eukprot:gene15406-21484_t
MAPEHASKHYALVPNEGPSFFSATAAAQSAPSASSTPGGTMQRDIAPTLAHALANYSSMQGKADAARSAPDTARSAHELARVRRDLEYHCRHDTLLGTRQKTANEVTYLLKHKLGMSVVQPADIDVIVPQLRLAVMIEEASDATAGNLQDPLGTGIACLASIVQNHFSPTGIASTRRTACPEEQCA